MLPCRVQVENVLLRPEAIARFLLPGCQPHDCCAPVYCVLQIENVLLRRAAKVKAAYQKSLNPRLLVPVGLGLLIGIANKVRRWCFVMLLHAMLCYVVSCQKVTLSTE
jgi:hypothetical protein